MQLRVGGHVQYMLDVFSLRKKFFPSFCSMARHKFSEHALWLCMNLARHGSSPGDLRATDLHGDGSCGEHEGRHHSIFIAQHKSELCECSIANLHRMCGTPTMAAKTSCARR